MTLKRLLTVMVAVSMVSVGLGTIFSDNAKAAFIENLSGNGLQPNFVPYDTAWNDAGTMAVVVGYGAGARPHAYAYFPDNDTYVALNHPSYNSNQKLYGVEYSRERYIPKPKVLVVDADVYDELRMAYQTPLSACNADVTYWDVWEAFAVNQGKPDITILRNYDVVIWVPSRDMTGMGGAGDAFTSTDEANVAAYLDGGGNFFLSNTYYTDHTDGGSDTYTPGDFAYDYLGISHIMNDWSIYNAYVNESIGDAVYDGLGQCNLNWNNYGWSSPGGNDEIAAAGGTICFSGTDSSMVTYVPMGIRYNTSTFKSVFLGFPFEVLDSQSYQEDLMRKTLEWFVPNSQVRTSPARALLVDADYYNDGLVNAYRWPLENNSWEVMVWDVYGNDGPAQGKPDHNGMDGYNLVIWVPTRDMTGDGGAGDAFNSADENEVENYLGGGGYFFLSNIYWSDYTSGGGSYGSGDFAYDVFGIGSMNNRYSDKEDQVGGTVGDIFEGFGPANLDWNRYGWTGQPFASDEINAMNGWTCMDIIKASPYSSYPGGIRYEDGTFKAMFMGFPVETMQYPDTDAFWNTALEWFVPGSTSYDPENFTYRDVWWVCGDDASVGANTVYRVVPSEGLSLQDVGVASSFQTVAVDHLGNPLFAGIARSDMQYYDYINDQWYSVNSGGPVMTGYDFYGMDFNENDGRFYITGEMNAGGQTLWYTDAAPLDSGSAKAYEFNYMYNTGWPLESIAWNQLHDYGLAVGQYTVLKVWPYDEYGNGTVRYEVINDTFGGYAYDVSWDTDGWNEAGIVGKVFATGNQRYWRYYHTNPILIDGYDSGNVGDYFTCAMKPPSSPKWLFIPSPAGGIRVNILEQDQSGQVTLDVNYPHIFSIGMWKTADVMQGSLFNAQVDADSTYTFYIEGNYTVAGADRWPSDAMLDIVAWYDGGITGSASAPGDNTWSSDIYRTRQFNITYDMFSGTAMVNYPAAPDLEITIDSYWEDPNVYPGERHRLYINITLGAQTYAADGLGFAQGPPLAGDIYDMNNALNDPDSWDLNIALYDKAQTNVRNDTYEEFGIREYASISVFGNPSGSAPPGATNYALTTPSQIYYSSNKNYYVNVSIPHLYKDGVVGPTFIPASNVQVRNVHSLAPGDSQIAAATSFPGPDTDLCVWGNPGTPLNVVLNGTVSAGPGYSDYTADSHSQPFEMTEVYWWITVPAGLPEGTYRATITFTITNA